MICYFDYSYDVLLLWIMVDNVALHCDTGKILLVCWDCLFLLELFSILTFAVSNNLVIADWF